ncbi:MAG: hypothetical protein Q8M94_21720 [Ignavibacteria bacterium]|nr:hypothetical protein [Ignavibacteria bacterium]
MMKMEAIIKCAEENKPVIEETLKIWAGSMFDEEDGWFVMGIPLKIVWIKEEK